MKLLCFPHAGGNSASYRGLGDAIDFIRIQSFDLPGRGRRIREKPLDDMASLVDDLFDQIRASLNEPYAFFGHSMGASLAYLLARKVAAANLPLPSYLFVSGRCAPSEHKEERRHLLPKAEFLAMLRELGGCPSELLADGELQDLFEPILRADFRAISTFRYPGAHKLDVPILVMIGDQDNVSLGAARKWQLETSRTIRIKRFAGNHFFIMEHMGEIRQLILKSLTPPSRVVAATGRFTTYDADRFEMRAH